MGSRDSTYIFARQSLAIRIEWREIEGIPLDTT